MSKHSIFLKLIPDYEKINSKIIINLFGLIINIGVVIGPAFGGVLQILKFKKLGSSYGFSLNMSMKILMSNALKVIFWFGVKYNIYLLFQALLVIIMQFVIIFFYNYYRDKRNSLPKQLYIPEKSEKENNFQNFCNFYFSSKYLWNWDTLWPYLIYFVIGFLFVLGLSFIIGFSNKIYMNIIGTLAAIIDIILCLPQIILNYNLKNAAAVSFIMVCLWVLGDSFRLGYYIITHCPFQFIICGVLHTISNLVLLSQVIYYHKGPYILLIIEILENNNSLNGYERLKTDEENISDKKEKNNKKLLEEQKGFDYSDNYDNFQK